MLKKPMSERDKEIRRVGQIPHHGPVKAIETEKEDAEPFEPRLHLSDRGRTQLTSQFKPDKPSGTKVPMPNEGPEHRWPIWPEEQS